MKNFLKVLCIATSFASSVFAESKLLDSAVFLHTLRNSPKIEQNGNVLNLKQDALVKAEGLKIECNENQYDSLNFSNSVVIVVKANTTLKISQFKQVQPFEQKHSDSREQTNSILHIELEKGSLDVISLEQRTKSELKIDTKIGSFAFKSREFSIEQKHDKINVFVLSGQVMFTSKTGKQDFIRSKQYASASLENASSNYPLIIEQFGMIVEREIRNRLSPCRQINDSVKFDFDENKNLVANRIIFKEFLLKKSKYEYRK